MCGSTDLNARMRAQAIADLQNQNYLENTSTGVTIENIVDSEIMPRFEENVKRAFDTTKKHKFPFRLRGLHHSEKNLRLQEDYYVLRL